ncbi:MAG TPA: LytTR family DNA-binding domain-containing protein, partial [Flavisolibacter sp.]|nr:LytTR family DNA-binding domain-containing protein [Flavisolibacter sp.]
DGKSFEIFKKVNIRSRIIFTTAYDEYALKAFKYNSIDYLLKPLKKADLDFALQKYRSSLPSPPAAFDVFKLLEQFKEQQREFKSRFLVKKGTRFFTIDVAEVAMAYTKERTSFIKKFSGEEYIIDETLDELEGLLDPARFHRVNRQFIISYKSVEKVFAWFDGKLKLSVNPAAYEDIIISRLKATDFKKWLGK